ncbi:Type II secretion system protein F [Anatilimnocola aggregata]|uniref:Type II secretion system protein F n=1 Tax=Anatilimnocola aggregata TaxID=2528021 RepID=A0A517YM11_9BACT|nr:type II secretion system F family protein [Anatilimnocola aggregata]QDU31251.1 Type II secretion system protein F [Anatilimnocola aggregata]
MPTFQFEAMDATGAEIRDVIDAGSEEEAQATIRQMGYFVTKIAVKRQQAGAKVGGKSGKKRSFALGGASTKQLALFTKQLSILQDAGLPIVRSLRILETQQKPGKLKNALMDVGEEIEGGATLSEAMGKSPGVFSRLYINMIKAGEAGGALEVILRRLSEFLDRSESLKRKVKGAMIYPVVVVLVACLILIFIMLKIVPVFQKMFEEFGLKLPVMTEVLINLSKWIVKDGWWSLPLMPVVLWIGVKLIRKFKQGRMGWDLYWLKLPIIGMLTEKNIMARTTRTLGTLVSSGVPILEALTITRETAGNAMFERMYGKVTDAIREGETIAKPMGANARPGFHPVTAFLWFGSGAFIPLLIMMLPGVAAKAGYTNFLSFAGAAGICGLAYYLLNMNARVVDELVVNMVDVGEETGELDTMLYKVADLFDEEVSTLTDGLMKLIEPLLICFLGGAVGFIVIALFLPLISLIQGLT